MVQYNSFHVLVRVGQFGVLREPKSFSCFPNHELAFCLSSFPL
uniref:Uncharacterized protein n=1 Tax=Tetranychus urticae TaxID=32264 RepID=T1K173_TETUR